MKTLALFVLFMFPISIFGQADWPSENIRFSAGYSIYLNSLNKDYYLDFMYEGAVDPGDFLNGINMKFSFSTKRKNLESFVGMLVIWDGTEIQNGGWQPGNTNSSDFIKNGGGVFAGVSPGYYGKHFGITSDFAIGVFSIKEYSAIVHTATIPYYDFYEKKASFGLGAMSSVGVYVSIGPVGIHPQVQAVFSGGNDASFLFYGFVLPLTISF